MAGMAEMIVPSGGRGSGSERVGCGNMGNGRGGEANI
jgi:hypothetical protein